MFTLRHALAIVVLAIYALFPRDSRADDPVVPSQDPTPTGNEGGPLFDQVDPASGAMVQNYRFALPAARGLQGPELSLNYNSSTRDREAGFGWGLDLPTIELRPLSGVARLNADIGEPKPRFVFGGQPIVEICTVGDSCPAEPSTAGHPGWATGWTYFRLQVESIFVRIYRSQDQQTWRVQFKGGEILEFGKAVGENYGLPDALERTQLGTYVRWHPIVRRDPQHPNNIIAYKWQLLGSHGTQFLTDIYDTPALASPTDLSSFAHHTQLSWAPLPYALSNHQGPDRAVPDLRLTQVATASKTWSASGARETYSVYLLSYYDQRALIYDSSSQGPLFHHSFLKQLIRMGHCGQTEDGTGHIPNQQCQSLPPLNFQYSSGTTGLFAATISTINAGPANAADKYQVLPNPDAAAIVDFDRDGLPDVVQSWPATYGVAEIVTVRDHGDSGEPELWYLPADDPGADGSYEHSMRSARPILGYMNTGKAGVSTGQFTYQCMDAGPLDLPNSITALNAGSAADQRNHIAEFLNGRANTALGVLGETLGIWGRNRYLPFYARSLEQGTFGSGPPPPEFALGGCDMYSGFNSGAFYPRWRWESGALDSWTLPVPRDQTENPPPETFVDIDGDGYVDTLLRVQGGSLPLFDHAQVRFTRKFGVGDDAPQAPSAGSTVSGPAVVPFVDGFNSPVNSLMPILTPDGKTSYFYADMNGDGLQDLVTQTFDGHDAVTALRIRPGDGTGLFTCTGIDPWPCTPEWEDLQSPEYSTSYYEATFPADSVPWTVVHDGTQYTGALFYLHDVTGDGLADAIQVAYGIVEVWVNLDGKNFACLGPGGSCAIGSMYDSVHSSVFTPSRLTFADMDADGVDDIVGLGTQGIFWGSFFSMTGQDAAAAGTSPGQLVRIDDAAGAATRIKYQTVQQLDLDARATSTPWKSHSPIPESVVTQILKDDTVTANGGYAADPYRVSRSITYSYRDPAFDSWSRKLVGFRKVASQVGNDSAITETTFWFGACENAAVPSATASGTSSTNYCPLGTDDEFAASSPTYRSWVGKPVRTDRYIPGLQSQGAPTQFLWSTFNEYTPPTTLLTAASGRTVTFSYVKHSQTNLYRPDQIIIPGGTSAPQAGGDTIEAPPTQLNAKVLDSFFVVDTNGTLVESTDNGDPSEPSDRPRVVQSSDNPFGSPPAVTCDENWRCLPAYVTTAADIGGSGGPVRQLRMTYDSSTRDLREIEAYLDADQYVFRGGDPTVPAYSATPPGMATAGWKSQAKYDYSPEGVIQVVQGPGVTGSTTRSCTKQDLDDAYGQFPKVITTYRDGCNSAVQFETTLSFDRHFGKVTTSLAPDLGMSMVELDAFGRESKIYAPATDQVLTTTQTAQISYDDSGPSPFIDTTTFTGAGASGPIRSVQIMNGLGEPIMRMDQGDGATWNVVSWIKRDSAGRVAQTMRPFASPVSSDPTAIALYQYSLSLPSAGQIVSSYDAFGRLGFTYEDGTTTMQRTYEPLATTSFDAEQIPTGAGSHIGGSTRVELTSRGAVRRVKESTATAGTITTETTFDVLGQPTTVAKYGTADAVSLTRYITWDSLGRLVQNLEPNSDSVWSGIGWVYAWDDNNRLVGTSDGRGCGKDIYYDGLGRVLGEDWSPCTGSQSYTAANPATGEGFEVLNAYDTYESGQLQSDGSFVDDAVLATGRLVSTVDRGSHTRFSYDNRGRVRRVERQVAKPISQQGPGIDPIAPHWYKSRSDFDNADRIVARSSGADEGVFASGSGTVEGYGYSTRGLLSSIASTQHGAIISNITYDPDGQANKISYGDAAHTSTQRFFGYQRRLNESLTSRSAPALWSTASAGYTRPGASTTQTNLANLEYAYDLVGNPKGIVDASPASSWGQPAYYPQGTRRISYDDLYRVTSVSYAYNTAFGSAAFGSPFAPELAAGDNTPFPLQTQLTNRIKSETFAYDSLGNTTTTTDDANANYDRSLGIITNGYGTGAGPNQLTAANGVTARYDESGNLSEWKINRTGTCPSGGSSMCGQWLAYEWDEVGQLARARRWDFPSTVPDLGEGVLPADPPSWDLHYSYSGGQRVVKSALDASGVERHTIEVFSTLRLDHDQFLESTGDYERSPTAIHAYLGGGIGHVFDDGGALPAPPSTPPTRLFLNIGDSLGSTTVTIDHTTGEVVERSTYTAYGSLESDYRPARWGDSREPYKFTGKEEDIEVGAIYFGARYYNPHLGRFLSPDPLAIHGLGGDLNPYAYVRGGVFRRVDPVGLDGEDSAGGPMIDNVGYDSPSQMPEDIPNEGVGNSETLFNWINRTSPGDQGPFPSELSLDNDPENPLNPWASLGGISINWWRLVDPNGSGYAMLQDAKTVTDPKSTRAERLVAGVMIAATIDPLTSPEATLERGAAKGLVREAAEAGGGGTTTFFRGMTYGEALETVEAQGLSAQRIGANQALNPGAAGSGAYITSQEATAGYYGDLAGLQGRGLGPAVVRIDVPTGQFNAFASRAGISVETPIPRGPFPGATETLIPTQHIGEFNGMCIFCLHH